MPYFSHFNLKILTPPNSFDRGYVTIRRDFIPFNRHFLHLWLLVIISGQLALTVRSVLTEKSQKIVASAYCYTGLGSCLYHFRSRFCTVMRGDDPVTVLPYLAIFAFIFFAGHYGGILQCDGLLPHCFPFRRGN